MEPAPAIELDHKRHADELRETWQARVLRETNNSYLGAVVLSVLAHNFDDAMPVLLRVVFPNFKGITAPFLTSAGKIAKTGSVVADVISKDGQLVKNAFIFPNTAFMQRKFREVADKLKLSDVDRLGLFAAIGKWLVCDYRLDPTMDPKDPDARRLH